MDELIRLTTTITVATTTISLTASNCTRFSRYKVDPIFVSFCVCSRARACIYSWHPGAIARTAYFDLDKSEEPWLEIPVLTIARIAGM